jgi:hypothetical protein
VTNVLLVPRYKLELKTDYTFSQSRTSGRARLTTLNLHYHVIIAPPQIKLPELHFNPLDPVLILYFQRKSASVPRYQPTTMRHTLVSTLISAFKDASLVNTVTTPKNVTRLFCESGSFPTIV